MQFEGHELYKINRNWIFDLTTFIGYRVLVSKRDEVEKCKKAFKISDAKHNGNFVYVKYIEPIPVGVLRKSGEVIRAYYEEALVCDGADKH